MAKVDIDAWLALAATSKSCRRAAWGLANALVPIIVKSQIEKIASSYLGHSVTVGSVDVKPWSLELNVNDVAIVKSASSNSASPQVDIKLFYIDAELESLL